MQTRFSDNLPRNAEFDDFILRERRPLLIQLCLIFAVAFVAIYTTALIMNDLGNRSIFLITLSIIMGSLGWFTIVFATRNRDLVLATEFQNALLASAAQLSTRFCLITKRDGSIVYIDPGFQKFFPEFLQSDNRTLDGLLANGGIAPEQSRKLVELLETNEKGQMVLSFKDSQKTVQPTVVTVDPLPRPKGYFLIRGREYIEKRIGDAPAAGGVNSDLMAQTLYALDQGVLIADHRGIISYANPAIEEWLGYAPGGIVSASLGLDRVFHQYSGGLEGRPILDDFEGAVTAKRKNRTQLDLQVRQRLLKSNGQVVGLCAIVSPGQDVKKN